LALLLLVGLLLRLLLGLLLSPVLPLLPSNIDIVRECGIVLLHLLKFFLDRSQFFLTFESKNECIHLVIILNNWNLEAVFIWAHLFDVGALIVVAQGVWGGVIGRLLHMCWRRRSHHACRMRRSHHPHLHQVVRWSLFLAWGRRSGAAAVGASHLLHTWGRRSGAVVTGASHLVAWGRRCGAARGRSKPPIVVSGLPLRELWMLANHRWSNVEKTTSTR
jgi:hypothetical protein